MEQIMILLFGDTHGSLVHVLPAVLAEKPAAIIFLGDIQAQKPLEQERAGVMDLTDVWFIPGNHDTDSRADYDNLFNSALADKNLHGRVVEIDGLRVAGLGGVFRESVWYPRYDPEAVPHYETYDAFVKSELAAERWKEYRRLKASGQAPDGLPSPALLGKALTHKSTIFYEDWLRLYGQRADILVTHEAPSCHPNGFIALDVLAQSMRVKYAFHGHQHDRLNYSEHEERLGFSANGVGFRAISDQWGGMIRAGDFDEQRMNRQYRDK
jgi:predicted phosphodiesterase